MVPAGGDAARPPAGPPGNAGGNAVPETTREHAPAERRRSRVRPLDAVGLLARGFAMGAADVVPGVSGGTIAFITGVYERFIAALRSLSLAPLVDLARGRPRAFLAGVAAFHWEVLAPIGIGIVAAILSMSGLITTLMDEQRGPTFAFFFGLILASAWVPLARMRTRTVAHAAALLATGAAAWFLVGLQSGPIPLRVARAPEGATAAVYPSTLREPGDLDAVLTAVDDAPGAGSIGEVVVLDRKGALADAEVPGRVRVLESEEEMDAFLRDAPPLLVLGEDRAELPIVFGCGAIAISAMVLPGVSGSFLLLFLGQYHAVLGSIDAVKDHALAVLGREPGAAAALTARPWWADALFLGAFLAGVGVGLLVFSRVVSWLFERAHDVTMAALTGLMLGALRLPAAEVLAATPADGGAGYWAVASTVAVVAAASVIVINSLGTPRGGDAAGAQPASG
mgnify:CR=1 FL=1